MCLKIKVHQNVSFWAPRWDKSWQITRIMNSTGHVFAPLYVSHLSYGSMESMITPYLDGQEIMGDMSAYNWDHGFWTSPRDVAAMYHFSKSAELVDHFFPLNSFNNREAASEPNAGRYSRRTSGLIFVAWREVFCFCGFLERFIAELSVFFTTWPFCTAVRLPYKYCAEMPGYLNVFYPWFKWIFEVIKYLGNPRYPTAPRQLTSLALPNCYPHDLAIDEWGTSFDCKKRHFFLQSDFESRLLWHKTRSIEIPLMFQLDDP